MHRPQCVLALVMLYVGMAHCLSWDFATGSGRNLIFFSKGVQTHSENITSGKIEQMTYDVVHNRIFFTEDKHNHTLIFSYDIKTKKTESVVPNAGYDGFFSDIDYDPVEEILFWTHYENGIYSYGLKPGTENNVYGNHLINLTISRTTSISIAVDSCRGYIYWATAVKGLAYTIERARFDGSERQVVIGTNLRTPNDLVIDQQTQKMYWVDGTRINEWNLEKYFHIESADLNGNNRTILYREREIDVPKSLAVSKGSIYWVYWHKRVARHLPKSPLVNAKPQEIEIEAWDPIVTNYKIEDQIRGIQDCEPLKTLSVTNNCDSSMLPTDVSLFCVNGTKVSGESRCECTQGYIGERCDVSVCQNYCFQGDCIVSAEGHPKCRCNVGYSGDRCEVNLCQGYCLNDGVCSSDGLSDCYQQECRHTYGGQPMCSCVPGYYGTRCEVDVCQGYCLNGGLCSFNPEMKPVCECKADYEGARCDVPGCLNRLNEHFQTVSMLRHILNADATPATLGRAEKSTCAATIF